MDPLAGTPWSRPSTVEGFVRGAPNGVLLEYAARVRPREAPCLLDIGCGAGRNAVPLARAGWRVLALDLSLAMVAAGRERARREAPPGSTRFALAPMHALPVRTRSVDFIVAHGIWNLARTTAEFRTSVREAARVASPGAGLFVFTFSRHTLPAEAEPVDGEAFVFTQFSGQPQCFLTEAQLMSELDEAGFVRDASVPLTEYNSPKPGRLNATTGPVIYEAAFRRTPAGV